jgi:hypothetical protein
MKTCRKLARNARKQWSIARFHRKICRAVKLRMSPEEAAKHLERIALTIFWLCVVCPDGSSTNVAYIFKVDVRTLSREIGAPTSPQLIADLTEGLQLLRDHAIAFGCWGGPKRVAPPLACPAKEVDEEWLRWAPAYLRRTDAQNADHPWT